MKKWGSLREIGRETVLEKALKGWATERRVRLGLCVGGVNDSKSMDRKTVDGPSDVP